MLCRSLRVWMFALALLGALAFTVRAGAKPPDLPVDPNDTIPLLPPPMIPDVDEPSEPALEMPMPEPMPGWPPIIVQNNAIASPYGLWSGCGWDMEFQSNPSVVLYRTSQGLAVSVDSSPTMTIFHPVRPLIALSVQRTLDECLLIGAHPLLSLLPLPDSLREERHTQEVIPLPPMQQIQLNGTLLFGVGVNCDAGVVGNAAVKMELHPVQPAPREVNDPLPEQHCPFAGTCGHYVPMMADAELSRSVLGNLEKLVEAEKLYQSACQQVGNGQYAEALECLKQVVDLCPASRYEEMSADLMMDIVCRVLGFRDNDADAEEQEDPEIQCNPYWYGDDGKNPDCCEDLKEPEICAKPCSRNEPEVPKVIIQALIANVDVTNCKVAELDGIADSETVNRMIRQLKADGRLEVLCSPQVMTLENQTANVFVGQQFPIITGTTTTDSGSVTPSVKYQPVGVELAVTPKIGQDGNVQMRVAMKVSSAQMSTLSLGAAINSPKIMSHGVETTIAASDGESVAISGPITVSTNKIETKVPYLGDLPVIGPGFRVRTRTESKEKLLVILTPHIVRCKADVDKILEQENKRTDSQPKPQCVPGCGMPCGKAPGVDEQVTGLLKACHLTLTCGDHCKAVQLAREAYALDAERVAADPVVYKMHLIALKMDKGDCCCDDCDCGPDCCCDKDCCCEPKACPCRQQSPPCVCVETCPPTLPQLKATIIVPVLEVVEEESEAHEVPKADAKPYRLETVIPGTVLSYDDLLRFLPGDVWTEYNAKTSQMRLLWRVRAGGSVYCLRYDGGVSLNLAVTPPMGACEDCEDEK